LLEEEATACHTVLRPALKVCLYLAAPLEDVGPALVQQLARSLGQGLLRRKVQLALVCLKDEDEDYDVDSPDEVELLALCEDLQWARLPCLAGAEVLPPEQALRLCDLLLVLGSTQRIDLDGQYDREGNALKQEAKQAKVLGEELEIHAAQDCRVLTMGHGASTTLWAIAQFAPTKPRSQFTALSRQEQQRHTRTLMRLGPARELRNLLVWGNPSGTLILDQSRVEAATPLLTERLRRPLALGAERPGPPGPLATASGAIAHLEDWYFGSPEGQLVCAGVLAAGEYGVEGLCVSLPCVCKGGAFEVVPGLEPPGWDADWRKCVKECTRLTDPGKKLFAAMRENPSGGLGGFNQYGCYLACGEWVEDRDDSDDSDEDSDLEVDRTTVIQFRLINDDGVLRGKWNGHIFRGRVNGLEVTLSMGVGGVEAVGTLEDREEAGVVLEWDEPEEGVLEGIERKGELHFGHHHPWKKLALTKQQKSFLDSQGTFRATKLM